jgi:hypothetical protein
MLSYHKGDGAWGGGGGGVENCACNRRKIHTAGFMPQAIEELLQNLSSWLGTIERVFNLANTLLYDTIVTE